MAGAANGGTQLLAGRYELLRKLDAGGMAEVYLARQLGAAGFEKHVVVKRIHDHLASEPRFVEMFLDEARVAANLRHPNIVSTLDLGEDDGTYFIVLEYLEGCSIRRLARGVRRSGGSAFPLVYAIQIVIDAARGLHHAHTATDTDGNPLSLVHRDVSPENLFITRQGVTRVLDFGIAKAKSHADQTTGEGLKGKLAYLSPEQARSEPVDARSDQFALGLVLYELIAGMRAYSGKSDIELYSSAASGKVDTERLTDSPRSLQAVLSRALAPKSGDRYASCAAFADALDKLRRELPLPTLDLSDYVRAALVALSAQTPASAVLSDPGSPAAADSRTVDTKAISRGALKRAGVADLPTPTVAKENQTNIRADRSSFVGRVHELEQLGQLWNAGHVAITLRGTAGAGKTRLSREFARRVVASQELPGGVWFCDLTDATTAAGICHVVGRELQIPLADANLEASNARLGTALAARGPTLLLLDNFEQVITFAADTVGVWLEHAPELRIISTSRELLDIDDEVALELSPLSVAGSDDDSAEAVALFLSRARSIAPSRTFDDNDPTIAEIVRRLDGLPLAIELAAARLNVLTPAQVLERLDKIDILRKRKGGSKKKSTLRGALDWSWDLLDDNERAAFGQCSVFRGGFTLEAAEAVVELGQVGDILVADALESLREKSLLLLDQDTMRFGMLETTRAYAGEKLDASGGRAEAQLRHAAHFADLGRLLSLEADREFEGFMTPSLERLGSETENLVAAFESARQAAPSLERDNRLLELATAIAFALRETGPRPRPLELLASALELTKGRETDDDVRLFAKRIHGWYCLTTSSLEHALEAYKEAARDAASCGRTDHEILLELCAVRALCELSRLDEAEASFAHTRALAADLPAHPSPLWEAVAGYFLRFRSAQMRGTSQAEMVEWLERGLELSKKESLKGWEWGALGRLANAYGPAEAKPLLEQALAIREGLTFRYNLGIAHLYLGELDEADAQFARTVRLAKRLGDRYAYIARGAQGSVLFSAGKYAEAKEVYVAVAPHLSSAGRLHETAFSVALGACEAMLGNFEQANALFDKVRASGDAGLSVFLSAHELLTSFLLIARAAREPDNAAALIEQARKQIEGVEVAESDQWPCWLKSVCLAAVDKQAAAITG